MNLLNETLECLKLNEKTPEDIKWVGTPKQWFTWDEFKSLANFDYKSGYGSQKIAKDLMIVGDNWYLERSEYDGSEWWDYRTMPNKPNNHIVPPRLGGDDVMWEELEDIK